MFRLVDRYLIKEILPYFFLSLLLLTSIVFIHEANRFSELFVIFSRRGLDGWPLVELVISLLPSILIFTLPIALLLGILMGLGRMASDSELIVMRASGIGRWRLFAPIAFLALAVSAITWYDTAYLLPSAVRSLNSLKTTRSKLLLQGIANQVKPGVFEESLQKKVFFIKDIDRASGEWRQIFLAQEIDAVSEPQILIAERGELQLGQTLERSELHLYNGVIYESFQRKRREQNKATAYSFDSTSLRFDLSRGEEQEGANSANDGKSEEKKVSDELIELNLGPEMQTLPELLRAPEPSDTKMRLQLAAERHKRFAFPAACLVFALMGVALALAVQRGGRASGFVVGICVTMIYYLLFIAGEDLARQGAVNPGLGIWMPNIIIGFVGFITLTRYQWISDRFAVIWWRCQPTLQKFVRLLEGERLRISTNRVTFGFPRLIDRMILAEMTRYFFIVLAGITVVFLVFTLFELTNDIVKYRVGAGVIMSYLLFLTPQIMNYAAPFSVLVSVLVTFGLFGKTSQLVALNASGQSFYRLALPALLYSIITGSFLFASQEYVLPFANRRQEYLRYQIKGGQLPAQTFYQANRKWFRGQDNRLIHFKDFDRERNHITGLAIYELDDKSAGLVRRISANTAHWDEKTQEWVLLAGFLRTFDGAHVKQAERFKEMRLQTLEKPEYFKMQVPETSKMSIGQLLSQIEQLQASGIDGLNLRIALQTKMATPVTCLVMALMGIPFALAIGKRGALAGVGVSIFIAIGFWGTLELFTQMGRYELLPPLLSAWGPNLLFSASGLYMLFTTKT
jgi:LPS export ABC transporter permease LptG/LPS export ABC transporter permease LptF